MKRATGVLAVLAMLLPLAAAAQDRAPPERSINAGDRRPSAARPFAIQDVASFDTPWALAFLPDGRMLVTERPGRLFVVTQQGGKAQVQGVPAVAASGQNGLLDVAPAPDFAASGTIYFTFAEPGPGGSSLALARARLGGTADAPALDGLRVIWRQEPKGSGGHPGGIIAFSPDGQYLFLTAGERMRFTPAQDLDQALGKLLRLNLDGTAAAGNPWAREGGVRAHIWSYGHRNPYGLAFAPDGRLWLHEMGPRGGDELNLIVPGRNYGWPLVSNGDNYSGTPIPRHETRPDLAAPAVYWTPVIAPAGMAFYGGTLFPGWRGSALIGGLVWRGLVRVAFDAQGRPDEAERWDLGARIRDVAVGPDGAVWVLEDGNPGRLRRLVPAGR